MRILIVDEQPLFRDALTMHLEAIYPAAVIFEAGSLTEAEGVLAAYPHFDLIILDIPVLETDGEGWVGIIRKKAVSSKIVVMSCFDDVGMISALIDKGANGYISKSAVAGDVRNALHLVLAGETYVSPVLLAGANIAPQILQHAELNEANSKDSSGLPLTPCQLEVFRLMAQGLPNKSIATQLNRSNGTVKLHVSAILKALKVKNRTEAVQAGTNKLFPQ